MLDTAETAELAVHHDHQPLAQGLRLLHRVRRQDYARLVLLRDLRDHVPHETARFRVHPRRRLVQEYNLRVA